MIDIFIKWILYIFCCFVFFLFIFVVKGKVVICIFDCDIYINNFKLIFEYVIYLNG